MNFHIKNVKIQAAELLKHSNTFYIMARWLILYICFPVSYHFCLQNPLQIYHVYHKQVLLSACKGQAFLTATKWSTSVKLPFVDSWHSISRQNKVYSSVISPQQNFRIAVTCKLHSEIPKVIRFPVPAGHNVTISSSLYGAVAAIKWKK